MLKRFNKFSEGILKWGIAALILGVPLYPKFPFISVPGTYVSIRLEDFLVFCVTILWVFTLLPNIKEFLNNRINRAILLFLAVGLLSVVSGIFLTQTVSLHLGMLHWARRVEYLVCFFIGLSAMRRKGALKDLNFYIKCLLIVVLLAFVYGFGQKYFSWPVITTQNNEYSKGVALRHMPGGHLVSTFAGHYDLATFLILVFPLLYFLITSSKEVIKQLNLFKSVILSRLFIALSIMAGLWMLVYTASRISIVSYIGSVTLGLVLARRIKFIPVVLLISFIFIGLSSNLISRYMQIFEVYGAEEVAVAPPDPVPVVEDRSTSIRLNVEWPRAIRAFSKNPLLGTGFSSITLATDNDYLRLLGEAGILGAMAFLLIFFKVLLELLRNFRIFWKTSLSSGFVKSITAALPGIFLNAVFIDVFESSKFAILFWLMMGIVVGLLKYKNEEI